MTSKSRGIEREPEARVRFAVVARQPDKPRRQETARFGFIFAVGLGVAFLACDVRPSVALGTCGPTEKPNGIGICQPCDGIFTSGSITSAGLGLVFGFAGIAGASYTVSNNVGTFNLGNSNLSKFNFKAPPSAPLSLQPVNGSIFGGGYTATPSVPDLQITWSNWTGDSTGVVVNAQLSGHIDVNITGVIDFVPVSVNPTLTLTNLPVTITFGTDSSGKATISPSRSWWLRSGRLAR
jgi:hypothetical protein